MATRGPKPKPAALRLLEGNPGRRAINDEPKPRSGLPTCPAWIKDEARKEWKRVIREMGATGIITRADASTLAAYCTLWAAFHASAESGKLLPAHYIAQMRNLAAEFGLSPSSRARLSVAPNKNDDADKEAYYFGT